MQNSPKLLVSHMSPVVAKAVFVKVGLQVLRAHAVIYSADSTLHKAPESLNRLGVNVARDVDSRAVVYPAMGVTLRFQFVVRNVFIGVNGARRKDVFLSKPVNGFPLSVRSNASHYAAYAPVLAAFHHANDRNLVAPERWPSALADSLPLAAVVHLIHLNRRTLQLQTVLGQETPNLAEHAPRGFIGDASFPLNLLRGNTATSGTHEVHRIEPSLERSSGLLKNGASERIHVIPAMVTSESGTTRHAIVLALDTALLALSHTVRPALFLDVFKARIIARKLSVKIRHGVAKFLRDALLGFHGSLNLLRDYW